MQPCPVQRCVTEGEPFYWPVDETSYVLNDEGFPKLDEPTVRAVLQRSFGHWSTATCAGGQPLALAITQEPGTTSLKLGPRPDEPNDNVVAYLSGAEWDDANFDPFAFAYTFMWFDPRNGELRGSDMLFNGGRGELGVCPETGCVGKMVDLENVATHEAGHFLGLSHSDERNTTMWCGAQADEITKRNLSSDDIAGVCAIYAPDEVARRRPTARPRKTEGCSALTGRGEFDLQAAALLALTWLLYRRRSAKV
jgi:hypothetical protein